MKRREHQSGFSTTVILLFVLIVTALIATSLVVYQHHKPSNAKSTTAATTQTQTTTQPASTTSTNPQPTPIYASWPTYSNTAYGFSYHYPTNWTTSDEVTSDPKTSANSATKQEFGTGLKLTTDTKYNNTVVFEVLNEPIQSVETWYDQAYAQSSLNQVKKSTDSLKGKQSIQYDITNSGNESKLYLFAVGSKTYTFSSINESLNVQTNANYWSDFNNTFDSLVIN